MSIDLNWETLTSGPDGIALAERIRSFIHDKFQTVPLPRFIKSVTVHGFHFGNVPPELDLRDITDPLPDFYDGDLYDDESDEEEGSDGSGLHYQPPIPPSPRHADAHDHQHPRHQRQGHTPLPAWGRPRPGGLRADMLRHEAVFQDLGSPFLGTSTPGILGGPGLNYFPSHFGTGTQTPLAAVAGAHLAGSWAGSPADSGSAYTPSHSRNPSQGSVSVDSFNAAAAAVAVAGGTANTLDPARNLREKSSVSTLAPTSVGTSRPPTRDAHATAESAIAENGGEEDDEPGRQGLLAAAEATIRRREPRVEDVQALFRIRYSGDVRLHLTAEILLDYPMPSFVGIPLKLNITGLSFDGVGVLAHIRKRLHFCFLNPEDALAAVGPDDDDQADEHARHFGTGADCAQRRTKFGGLLQEIKVESEIGQRDGGKQSLKNVGKVERFVLEQVRRIFEEELVYPSFWTFLV